ncbi:MAG: hypothetical protein RLZZ383_358 [Pseudomonadota bacterium]
MVVIDPGTYTMGGGAADVYGSLSDSDVTLTHSFWMGKSEVTQAEWAAWTTASDTAPSYFTGDDLPVEQVSWLDAARYANALSTAEGLTPCYESDGSAFAAAYPDPYTCPGYRLPTEAEWEYAARAGEAYIYAGSNTASAVAWTYETSSSTTHDACTLAENAWGLCDMSGNVFEWTNDWYEPYYSSGTSADPAGPSSGSGRVFRGGAWSDEAAGATVANRYGLSPGFSRNSVGFRLSRSSLTP